MNIKELMEKQMKEKPNWFLFQENEPKVSPENVAVIEAESSAKLPFSCRYFVGTQNSANPFLNIILHQNKK